MIYLPEEYCSEAMLWGVFNPLNCIFWSGLF